MRGVWRAYETGGLAALQPQSRRPHVSPTRRSRRTGARRRCSRAAS